MFSEIVKLLKDKNIKFDKGLTELEIIKIENIYNFNFPYSLKIFLMENLPVSDGFYNWRDFSHENIFKINKIMNYFFEYIKNTPCDEYIPNSDYWPEKWGEMPKDLQKRQEIIIKEYQKAPKIIPIYSHRFMPDIKEKFPPILSIHYSDIVYYGRNLNEYFMCEFGNFEIQKDMQEYLYIPFWTDLMEN